MPNEIYTVDEHGKQKMAKLLEKLRGWTLQAVPRLEAGGKAGHLELIQKRYKLLWSKNTADRVVGLFYRNSLAGDADSQMFDGVLGVWTECDDTDDRTALEIIAAKFLITRHRVTTNEIRAYDDAWQRQRLGKKK